VGTEDAGIIALDTVLPEMGGPGPDDGRTSAGRTDKDKE
jgi:hypothetical protein